MSVPSASIERRPSLDQNKDRQIAAILVVGFHHAYGPIVEFCDPPLPHQKSTGSLERLDLPEQWSFLPFLALPDGAHQKDEDFAYFHLPPVPGWSVAETTLFGISCNRQIPAKDLLVQTPDITRSIVQKAVVVLARQPIFGPLRQKLAVVTASWFNQRDFTQLDILHTLYHNLNSTYFGPVDDSTLYMGTSVRELVHRFELETLALIKLLLLEKKIMFYGYPVERLCTYEYSLISLVPSLLRSLQDSGAPDLDTAGASLRKTEARELAHGDKSSLLRFMGLPLQLFAEGAFFQPYLPLQQLDMLSAPGTRSFLVGSTNQLFLRQKSDIPIDVLVNVEMGKLEIHDPKLRQLVSPTLADRRWMEKLVHVVHKTWDDQDPSRPRGNIFEGSDDYIRAQFEEYILSLLSSMKHAQDAHILDKTDDEMETLPEQVMPDDDQERNYLVDYGMKWLITWQRTANFRLWDKNTDHEIYEIVEPGHPGMGDMSFADIQKTVSNRLRKVRRNFEPLRESISKAMTGGAKAVMTTGRSRLIRGMDVIRSELEKVALEPSEADKHDPHRESSSVPPNEASFQAGRLSFSNLSSFLSRRHADFTQAMEESVQHRERLPPNARSGPSSTGDSDDDGSSTYVDVAAMLPLSRTASKDGRKTAITDDKTKSST